MGPAAAPPPPPHVAVPELEPPAEYLQEVLPLLQEALEHLGHELITQRRQLASGELWEEGGYRPADWQPVNPLQFISDFLRCGPARPRRAGGRARSASWEGALTGPHSGRSAARRARREHNPRNPTGARTAATPSRMTRKKAWGSLSKEEKLEACFRRACRSRRGRRAMLLP